MDNWLKLYIEKLQNITETSEYDELIKKLYIGMKEHGYPDAICAETKNRASYMKNKFSDENNREKMSVAKDRVVDYLSEIVKNVSANYKLENLEMYLNNFYLFLEALTEHTPDKRSAIKAGDLQKIKISNEYDLQHLLYATLKPLYPGIRKEVSRDSGIGEVRGDIEIPELDVILETKCTSKSMTLKKLTEQIEADITHYQKQNIIFYVYDKEKIIKDAKNYKDHFDCTFDGKSVKMIITQPVNL